MCKQVAVQTGHDDHLFPNRMSASDLRGFMNLMDDGDFCLGDDMRIGKMYFFHALISVAYLKAIFLNPGDIKDDIRVSQF